MSSQGNVRDLYEGHEIKINRERVNGKLRSKAWHRGPGESEWRKYPVRSAEAMLLYGAKRVEA